MAKKRPREVTDFDDIGNDPIPYHQSRKAKSPNILMEMQVMVRRHVDCYHFRKDSWYFEEVQG